MFSIQSGKKQIILVWERADSLENNWFAWTRKQDSPHFLEKTTADFMDN